MYDGIVYEEGTPDEIFDHPKKPETIRFFKRMFILEEDICTRDHDFSGLSKKILELIYQRKLQGNYRPAALSDCFCVNSLVQCIKF